MRRTNAVQQHVLRQRRLPGHVPRWLEVQHAGRPVGNGRVSAENRLSRLFARPAHWRWRVHQRLLHGDGRIFACAENLRRKFGSPCVRRLQWQQPADHHRGHLGIIHVQPALALSPATDRVRLTLEGSDRLSTVLDGPGWLGEQLQLRIGGEWNCQLNWGSRLTTNRESCLRSLH